MFKYLLLAFLFIIISCNDNYKTYMDKGDCDTALKLAKQQLEDNYEDKEVRKDIITLYFLKAKEKVDMGRVEEAMRMLDKGMIYSLDNDSLINFTYAKNLSIIGEAYIKKGKNGSNFQSSFFTSKGVELIKRSIALGYLEGEEILKSVDVEAAKIYYRDAEKNFKLWLDSGDNYLLDKVEKYLEDAEELKFNKRKISSLRNKVISNRLFLKERKKSIGFDIESVRLNGGDLIINVNYYDNRESGYRIVDPEKFELIDSRGNIHKVDRNAYKKYSNVMLRRRVNAGSQYSGVIVFTNIGKRSVVKSLSWSSNMGESDTKKFPPIRVNKIKKDRE
ncbi:MAG: hypothetical protein CR982_05620 [Candidatus Cloacimonadota bacterium]|nr:MAG: hypothetical protein CR982_05620 [Candidatus Cloacimonadota bacterium]PIE81399.1 MAG: hypothetical protein CSA15_00750 [Candidatus Delongbacteria bacterium]